MVLRRASVIARLALASIGRSPNGTFLRRILSMRVSGAIIR